MARPSLRSTAMLILVGAAITAGTATARSQPADSGVLTPAQIEERSKKADALFKQGKSAYAKRKLEAAYDAYRQAFELKKSHDICVNLVNTEVQLGKKVDAVTHLAHCVRNFPPSEDQKKRKKAELRLNELRAEVGALHITANEKGAEIFIGDRSVGLAPLDFEVYAELGEHVITAKLPLHKPASQKVLVVKAGRTSPPQEIVLKLEPDAPSIVTIPTPLPTAPTAGSAAPPATTAPTNDVPPPPPPDEPGGPDKRILITGGAVAGAAAIAGISFVAVSFAKAGDAASKRDDLVMQGGPAACGAQAFTQQCDALASSLRARAGFANAATFTLIGAGSVALGTTIYTLVAPRKKAAPLTGSAPPRPALPVQVVPWATSREAAVVVQGTW